MAEGPQHAIYVNGALAALLGMDTMAFFRGFVIVLAVLVCLLFWATLENGRDHLVARRKAVERVEKEMAPMGTIHPLLGTVETAR